MVTKYTSISTRKLSNALKILTSDKSIVAMSDYNEFYKAAKRHLLTSTLGPNAQVCSARGVHQCGYSYFRWLLLNTMVMAETSSYSQGCHDKEHVRSVPCSFESASSWSCQFQENISIRTFWIITETSEFIHFQWVIKHCNFTSQNFSSNVFATQAIGEDIDSLYVKDLDTTLSRGEMLKILVLDPLEGAIEVDWRDFFSYLKWIPNKSFEHKIQQMHFNRQAVMKALIEQQKKRISSGEVFLYPQSPYNQRSKIRADHEFRRERG